MLLACWSPKGGSGTTVVAASLALTIARADARADARTDAGVVLADLGGDAAAVLGTTADGPGLNGWLDADDDVGPDALARLAIDVAPNLTLLPAGDRTAPGPGSPGRAEELARALAGDARTVVVDCGTVTGPSTAARALVAASDAALVVVRPCYLALRRACAAALPSTAAVVVVEPDRSLRGRDVEQVLGVPVAAEIPLRGDIARRVDAGLLTSTLPSGFSRRLAAVARHVGISA